MAPRTETSGTVVNLHDHLMNTIAVRDGVSIRPMQVADADVLLDMLRRDPTIRQRVSVAARMTDAASVASEVAAYQKDGSVIRYVIALGAHIVGLVSFWRDTGYFGYEPSPHDFGFGFFIDPDQRGQHLAHDAVEALMREATARFRVNRFVAFCEPDNQASQAVLRSLGLTASAQSFTEPKQGWQEVLWFKQQ